ncbi:tyrosinase [Cyathus striatus]|nr:tyrosinase [Cyathus striatus]
MSSDSPRFVITGVVGGSPNRLEINDFVRQEKQFSLYIQALQKIYSRDQSETLSFFQVGGIHGVPYVPWNDSTGPKPLDPRRQWGGYCVHGSVLFPTWHRPYMLLYEQILNQAAREIAEEYTVDTNAWKEAAANLRQPYWDWAQNTVPPAEVISLQQVPIITPDGKKTMVDNPLFRYRFHPVDSSFGRPYSQWSTTLRFPTSRTSSATSDINRMRSVLRSAQSTITTATFNMLTRVTTWPAFSSHTVGDGGSTSNSLEAIHDNIHGYVGGGGHMSDPAVAAFDPIFFLHHCNVDRLLSLWSAINPGVWVSAGDSEDGSFTMSAENPVDADTPLTPFWSNQTGFWASAGVTDTTKLGYSYPEFNGIDMGDTNTMKQAVLTVVTRLYGGRVFGAFASIQPTLNFTALSAAGSAGQQPIAAEGVPREASTAHVPAVLSGTVNTLARAAHNVVASIGHSSPPDHSSLWEWTARIEFKKYELGCSFGVLLFLGKVPENPDEWLTAPNYVGAHFSFVNSEAGQCANCLDQIDVKNEGFVHLNSAIAEHSGLGSFEPEVVEPYLKELKWRVQKLDGEPAELLSLEVGVIGTPLTLPPGAIIPVPGRPHHYNGITFGRPGGCRHA